MKIKEIDFDKCDTLKGLISFETTDTMPQKIPFDDRNWTRSKCFTYIDWVNQALHGLVVLKNGHGEYDERFIRQELPGFLNKYGVDVEFKESKKDQIAFVAVEQDGIVVDDGKTLIPIDYAFGRAEPEQQARQLKAISHYTDISSTRSILESRAFIAKSLSRYGSEKRFVENENSRRLVFIACFTKNLESNERMWKQFADDHRGCKIDIIFKNSFAKAFPLEQMIVCKCDNGERFLLPPSHLRGKGTNPHVYFTVHFSQPEYEEDATEATTLSICENGCRSDFTVLQCTGKSVLPRFEYQDEVRLLLNLHSCERTRIPYIQKVNVPFEISEIEKIVVTVGQNATEQARERIKSLCANSPKIFKFESEI